MEQEMIDRFGPLPPASAGTFYNGALPKLAVELGFERMILKNDFTQMLFHQQARLALF